MLKIRESFELVQGFGCAYRVTRRTWLIFGLVPVMQSVTREKVPG